MKLVCLSQGQASSGGPGHVVVWAFSALTLEGTAVMAMAADLCRCLCRDGMEGRGEEGRMVWPVLPKSRCNVIPDPTEQG